MFRFYDIEGDSCGGREVNVGSSDIRAINTVTVEPLLFTHHSGNYLSVDLNVAGSATKLFKGGT